MRAARFLGKMLVGRVEIQTLPEHLRDREPIRGTGWSRARVTLVEDAAPDRLACYRGASEGHA